jgi:ring-1,2-phenylacetyl-CoA epoxidase subunit PaaD
MIAYIVTITPTYTACPAMGMIGDQIKEILDLLMASTNVKVVLTYTPAWTTDWLSQEAKTEIKKVWHRSSKSFFLL